MKEKALTMVDRHFAYLESFFDVIKASVVEIQFNAKNVQDIILVALYGTIIEYCHSCIVLFKDGKYTAIPLILRSMLEANVDLLNLIKERDYSKSMTISYLHQKAQIIENILDKTPRTTFVEQNKHRFESELSTTKFKIKKLVSAGAKKLKIYEKFQNADIDQVYILYQDLCRESHNNLDRLEYRHIIRENSHFRVAYFKDWDNADIIKIISMTVRFLINPFRKIQEYFNLKETTYTKKVAELFFEYEEFEKSIFPSPNF